jgi:predicted O-methyltransferase YrrM
MQPYHDWMGWLSGLGDAAPLLYGIVKLVRPEVIVETGSARGYSTCSLALACHDNNRGTVYAVDPHIVNTWTDLGTKGETLPFLRERLKSYDLEDHCQIIRATSEEAIRGWDKPIDLLFIDGDHSAAGVKIDFEGFEPWLTPEALVIFHDSAWEHDRPWTDYRDKPYYREDMGVPAYLRGLTQKGYQSATFLPVPGLTVMHRQPGGFDFMARGAQQLVAAR